MHKFLKPFRKGNLLFPTSLLSFFPLLQFCNLKESSKVIIPPLGSSTNLKLRALEGEALTCNIVLNRVSNQEYFDVTSFLFAEHRLKLNLISQPLFSSLPSLLLTVNVYCLREREIEERSRKSIHRSEEENRRRQEKKAQNRRKEWRKEGRK